MVSPRESKQTIGILWNFKFLQEVCIYIIRRQLSGLGKLKLKRKNVLRVLRVLSVKIDSFDFYLPALLWFSLQLKPFLYANGSHRTHNLMHLRLESDLVSQNCFCFAFQQWWKRNRRERNSFVTNFDTRQQSTEEALELFPQPSRVRIPAPAANWMSLIDAVTLERWGFLGLNGSLT